jgi:hypothetical protein
LCARGDQQIEGACFNSSDLYAPTLKAPGARLLAATAAEHGCPLLKTDMRQERTKRYTFDHLTGGLNQYPKIMFSYFSRACMAQNRPPNDGIFASPNGWKGMDTRRLLLPIYSEKTIFMKRQGSDFIIHGLFVDDMMYVPTCDKLPAEFLQL